MDVYPKPCRFVQKDDKTGDLAVDLNDRQLDALLVQGFEFAAIDFMHMRDRGTVQSQDGVIVIRGGRPDCLHLSNRRLSNRHQFNRHQVRSWVVDPDGRPPVRLL